MIEDAVITNPSLPHQREILALVSLVTEAYSKPDFVGIIVTDTLDHGRWIIQRLHDSVRWDEASGIKLFREGVEVKGGGKVILVTLNSSDRLRGVTADKIVFMGRLGELYLTTLGTGAEIEAVA